MRQQARRTTRRSCALAGLKFFSVASIGLGGARGVVPARALGAARRDRHRSWQPASQETVSTGSSHLHCTHPACLTCTERRALSVGGGIVLFAASAAVAVDVAARQVPFASPRWWWRWLCRQQLSVYSCTRASNVTKHIFLWNSQRVGGRAWVGVAIAVGVSEPQPQSASGQLPALWGRAVQRSSGVLL